MAIKLFTLVDPWQRGESVTLGVEGAHRVEEALGTEGTLLRIWDAPIESGVSQYLVVQDPPSVGLIAGAIEGSGLYLDAVTPIVPSESEGPWARTEAEIISTIAVDFPETLLRPNIDPGGVSPFPILGLRSCGTCGGVGAHLWVHP